MTEPEEGYLVPPSFYSSYRERMDQLREQGEARNADRAMAPLEKRISLLEAALATAAQRLRYLADSVDPKEIGPELHALARQCEGAMRGDEPEPDWNTAMAAGVSGTL